ncbi:MAG: tripartite tricarboxylate transporter permease [Candidatus Aenigmarchaeota archaeon]|nr:tripartite tricarboxylate transporter permease [Candidatus Aenigmarchaeota archaeon]
MIFEIALYAFIGILLGVFTGLMPGIHVNTVSALLLAVPFAPLNFAALVLALTVTHTFFDFIPSVYLGAPEEETALSVLPGHKMLLQGRGYEAIALSASGALGGIVLMVLFLPLILITMPSLYGIVSQHIGFLVFLVALFMVRENTIKAVVVFLLAGYLGMAFLDYSENILLPILTGLFAIPSLIESLKTETSIPIQSDELGLDKKVIFQGSLAGFLSGIVVGILPGIGSSTAASLTQEISKEEGFLASLGAIATSSSLMSIISLYLIGKTRSGAAAAIKQVMNIGLNDVLFLVFLALVVGVVAFAGSLATARVFWRVLRKVEYRKLSLGTIALLATLTLALTGINGLLVLVLSSAVGQLAPRWGLKRSLNMGVLMVPTMVYYFGMLVS